MARSRISPGPKAYFDALRAVFELQAQTLTAVLPHMGERGRNDEERFRDFLVKTLPSKFGVGTGFVIASNGATSRQVDIVVYDAIQNSPLHRELAAFVFPIEMVYATIEVKGTFKSKDLKKCLDNLASVRPLAKEKRFFTHRVEQKEGGGSIGISGSYADTTAPRAFVVIYDAVGWANVDTFAASFANALAKSKVHLHGVVTIKQGEVFISLHSRIQGIY